MSDVASAPNFQLDPELTQVLLLASWIGYLRRRRTSSISSDPWDDWYSIAAACLIANDRTSRWIQAGAESGLLLRNRLLADPALGWQARRAVAAGVRPPDSAGSLDLLRDMLRPGVAAVRADPTQPVGVVHLVAAMVFATGEAHEKALHELAPPDGAPLRRFVAVWLAEFPHLLSTNLELEQRVADWFDGVNRYDRLETRPPKDAWCTEFTRSVPLRSGGGPLGPLLEAILATAPSMAGPDTSAAVAKDRIGDMAADRFLDTEKAVLRRCLLSGEVIDAQSTSRGRGGAVLVERARQLAERVSPGQPPGLRHLVGALVAADPTLPPLPADPPGDVAELRALRRRYAAIDLLPSDLRSAWVDAILGTTMTRVPMVLDTSTEDRLGFLRYARALTSVIADRSVVPPLSIGLFGAWGSGKSFLIERIRDELLDIAGRADAAQGGFCRGIVPVDFNAWHYAETNLWASMFVRILEVLGQHLSDQPAPDGVRTRVEVLAELGRLHAELEVLETTAIKQRAALDEARVQAGASAALREVLGHVLDREPPQDVSAALQEADKVVNDLREEAGAAQNTWSALRGLLRRFTQIPARTLLIAALPVVVPLGTITAVLAYFRIDVGAYIALIAGAIGTALSWLRPYRESLDHALASIDKAWRSAEAIAGPKQAIALKRTEARTEEVRREIAALQTRAEALEPRRQLANFVGSRAGSEEYTKLLGTAAMIRRDIEKLAEFLRARDATTKVERIVLIVDDLDRCSPDVVVRVLEAVHILLASSLFVVIVGVDPRWLCGALQTRFKGLLGAEDSAGSAAPSEFLEKIFQIPFHVPEMSAAGRRALAAASLPAPVDSALPAPSQPLQADMSASGNQTQGEQAPTAEQTPSRSQSPSLPTVRPVALEREEHGLLLTLSEVAGDTPRRLKRFLRCYMILRASLDRDSLADWREAKLYDPPARLLAAIAATPEAWPTVCEALRTAEDADTAEAVVQACTGLPARSVDTLKTVFGKAISAGDLRSWLGEVNRFTFPAGSRQGPVEVEMQLMRGNPTLTDGATGIVQEHIAEECRASAW